MMRKLSALLLLWGVASLLLPGAVLARGLAGPPSGPVLLREMKDAMQHAGSYHTHGTVVFSESGLLNETLTLDLDVSTRPVRAHEVLVSHGTRLSGPKTPFSTRVELSLVGKRAALRTNSAAWKCTTTVTLQSVIGQFVDLSSLAFRSATNLGAGTVGTVPVWRVRTVATIGTAAGQLRAPTIYSVGQHDHRLYASDVRVHAALEGTTLNEHSILIFSGFGESVPVTLPSACAR